MRIISGNQTNDLIASMVLGHDRAQGVSLYKDVVRSFGAGTVSVLRHGDPPPLSVTLWEDGGAPPGEDGVDAVTLTPAAQAGPLGVRRTKSAHLLTCYIRRYGLAKGWGK